MLSVQPWGTKEGRFTMINVVLVPFFFFFFGAGCVSLCFFKQSPLCFGGCMFLAVINKALPVFPPPGDDNGVHSAALQEAQQS